MAEIIGGLVKAVDPDAAQDAARQATGQDDPPLEAVTQAERELRDAAALPLASNPELRQKLIDLRHALEQTIDIVSQDKVLEAGFSADAAQRAHALTQSFRQFIEDSKDEIAALQALYSRPYRQRLTLADIRALADALRAPPRAWTPDLLWQAYEQAAQSKVTWSGQRALADIVSLVRHAIGQEAELTPFADHARQRFEGWLAAQEVAGRAFTPEQRCWLEDIRDTIAGSVGMELDDFQLPPFAQRGGLLRAYQLFGQKLPGLLEELSQELVA